MFQYALVSESGEVQHVVSMGADADYVDGQIYNGLTAVRVAFDQDGNELINTKYYVDGEWHTREAQSSPWQDWVNNTWVLNTDRLHVEIRRNRNERLALSDWTQFPDSPLTPEKKAEWAAYRQALRDIPANNSEVVDLADIIWPTSPI